MSFGNSGAQDFGDHGGSSISAVQVGEFNGAMYIVPRKAPVTL